MNAEEARERFSEAWEGALARGEQHAFEQLLAADSSLRQEYERFVEVAEQTRQLGDPTLETSIDLLPSLQARLRQQSRGRFFRDRFAQERKTRVLPMLVVSSALVLFVALWIALRAGLW